MVISSPWDVPRTLLNHFSWIILMQGSSDFTLSSHSFNCKLYPMTICASQNRKTLLNMELFGYFCFSDCNSSGYYQPQTFTFLLILSNLKNCWVILFSLKHLFSPLSIFPLNILIRAAHTTDLFAKCWSCAWNKRLQCFVEHILCRYVLNGVESQHIKNILIQFFTLDRFILYILIFIRTWNQNGTLDCSTL